MSRSTAVLVVDSNVRNVELLRDFLHRQGYETHPVTTLEQLEAVLNSSEHFALALVDISGFDRRIWEYCERLAEKDTPFIIISPKQVMGIQTEGRSHGAHDVLIKPLVVQELSALINSLVADE